MGRKHRHYENRMLKKYFNTNRLLDSQGRGNCDGKTDTFAIELFQRDIPKYITEEVEQAVASATDIYPSENLIPIIIMREKYKDDDDALVMMRLSDFMEFKKRLDEVS